VGEICKETGAAVTKFKVMFVSGFDPVGFFVFTFAKAKHNSSDVTRQRFRLALIPAAERSPASRSDLIHTVASAR